MTTIVRGTVPADEFALEHVLSTIPDVAIDVERIVESADDAVMPLVWIHDADRERLTAALREDPTVESVTLLASFENEHLYRMMWIDRIRALVELLTDGEGTILDVHGKRNRWQLRGLFPERERFSEAHDRYESRGLTFSVESIRELNGEPAGRYGLTVEQYRALVTAVENGYFEVPRGITLEELAETLDVSHQALSERIRRGCQALITDTMMIDDGEETTDDRSRAASAATD